MACLQNYGPKHTFVQYVVLAVHTVKTYVYGVIVDLGFTS